MFGIITATRSPLASPVDCSQAPILRLCASRSRNVSVLPMQVKAARSAYFLQDCAKRSPIEIVGQGINNGRHPRRVGLQPGFGRLWTGGLHQCVRHRLSPSSIRRGAANKSASSLPFSCTTLSESVFGKPVAHARKIPPDPSLLKMKFLLRSIKSIPDYITLT